MTDLEIIKDFIKKFPQYSDSEEKLKTESRLLEGDKIPFSCRIQSTFILAELIFDEEAILTSVMVNTDPKIDDDIIEQNLGKNVLSLVRNVEKIYEIRKKNKTLQQADSVRKMIFALALDIRVIFIGIALKLDNMRHLDEIAPELQKEIATESLEIWAPLSNRLGTSAVKTELEDLSLKYLNKDAYNQIKDIVVLHSDERSAYLDRATDQILRRCAKAGIEVTVTKRAKHFYSIYQKMKKRNKSVSELLDLFAIRIICEKTEDCYVLMGIVHSLWKPMDGRFKDYIANPKRNGYQSLHTTVICEGRPLEIQIRTREMHEIAENGMASHWLYKKGTNKDNVSKSGIENVNSMKSLSENLSDKTYFNKIRDEYLEGSIFVFTPNLDVKQLPAGSTAIDFAYAVHSRIGETIVGAKSNGHIIPLSAPLENTQVIEILTSPKSHPTENQLRFVKTAKSRSKINSWLQNHGLIDNSTKPITHDAQAVEAQSEGISVGEMQQKHREKKAEKLKKLEEQRSILKIKVGESSNFLINFANCCKPKPGDDIIGYVSRGRGIIVHKIDCPNFEHIPNIDVRTICVEWDDED